MCGAMYKHLTLCSSLFILYSPKSVLAARNIRYVWAFRREFLSVSCAVQHNLEFCRKRTLIFQGDVWPFLLLSDAVLEKTM